MAKCVFRNDLKFITVQYMYKILPYYISDSCLDLDGVLERHDANSADSI